MRARALVVGALTLAMALIAGGVQAQSRVKFGEPQTASPSTMSHANAAMFASALSGAAQGTTAQGPDTDHLFGAGLRAGGSNFGAGLSLRYFMDGPLGFQFDLTHYSIDYPFSNDGFGSTQFAPSVLYRLTSYKFAAPLKLQPYVGGGLSIVRNSVDSGFFEDSDSSVGVVITGGVELFFDRVPKLGVSGAFEFVSNGEFSNVSVGGPALVIYAHYYFK